MFDIRQLKRKMEYVQASDLIDASGYYEYVAPQYLEGTTMYGLFAADDDTMIGCIMAVVQGPQAYIDYLVVHSLMQNEGHALQLVKYTRAALYDKGVRDIHACVKGDNGASLRVCSQLEPLIGFPYTKMTFKLEE